MLIIYPKGGGDVVAIWSGNYNTLKSIYLPDSPYMLEILDELLLEDNREVINHYEQYEVIEGQLKLKTLE